MHFLFFSIFSVKDKEYKCSIINIGWCSDASIHIYKKVFLSVSLSVCPSCDRQFLLIVNSISNHYITYPYTSKRPLTLPSTTYSTISTSSSSFSSSPPLQLLFIRIYCYWKRLIFTRQRDWNIQSMKALQQRYWHIWTMNLIWNQIPCFWESVAYHCATFRVSITFSTVLDRYISHNHLS